MLDRARTQCRSKIRCRGHSNPLRKARDRSGFSRRKNLCLELTARALAQIGLEFAVLEQLAQVARRSFVRLASSELSIDRQAVPRARHCHVKQTPFLLFTESLLIRVAGPPGSP